MNEGPFHRDAHGTATLVSDAMLWTVSSVWFWLASGAGAIVVSTGQWLVVVEPELRAFGTAIIVFTLMVRAYIAVKDARSRGKRRDGEERRKVQSGD